MKNKYDIKNQIAVVTGGASGIGKGIVKNLLISGAQVAVLGRTEKSLRDLKIQVQKTKGGAAKLRQTLFTSAIQADI